MHGTEDSWRTTWLCPIEQQIVRPLSKLVPLSTSMWEGRDRTWMSMKETTNCYLLLWATTWPGPESPTTSLQRSSRPARKTSRWSQPFSSTDSKTRKAREPTIIKSLLVEELNRNHSFWHQHRNRMTCSCRRVRHRREMWTTMPVCWRIVSASWNR